MLPKGSDKQHESFIYQEAHEEIQNKVHQQAKSVLQAYEEIEDKT